MQEKNINHETIVHISQRTKAERNLPSNRKRVLSKWFIIIHPRGQGKGLQSGRLRTPNSTPNASRPWRWAAETAATFPEVFRWPDRCQRKCCIKLQTIAANTVSLGRLSKPLSNWAIDAWNDSCGRLQCICWHPHGSWSWQRHSPHWTWCPCPTGCKGSQRYQQNPSLPTPQSALVGCSDWGCYGSSELLWIQRHSFQF